MAEGHLSAGAGCRVKLALARNPADGTVRVQRLVLSTASAQIIIERRGEQLRVISSSAAKLRIA